MKAFWNGVVLAESDATILIEGNHYFPPLSVNREYFRESLHTTTCPWKGEAHYYDVIVPEAEPNNNAAWYYPHPQADATKKVGADFANYVAFWKGVIVR